jgi:hypothetical protein
MSWVDRRLLTLGVQLVATWMITKTRGEFLGVWAIIVGIQVACGVLYLLFACIGHSIGKRGSRRSVLSG